MIVNIVLFICEPKCRSIMFQNILYFVHSQGQLSREIENQNIQKNLESFISSLALLTMVKFNTRLAEILNLTSSLSRCR